MKTAALVLADTILILHFSFVLFVIFGLLAIVSGYFLQWQWVKNRTFRLLHLAAIGVVAFQSWIGVICPLTTWEMDLRQFAEGEVYTGSFIQYWLHTLLYFEAPQWVFMVAYTGFGGLVLASWFIVKPNPPKQ